MFENESWKVIEEFPLYSISDYGRVKHENRVEARKVSLNAQGFPIVVLFGKNGTASKTRYSRQVNQLVAEAFLPPPEHADMTSVWHLDGDFTNCQVENLKWDTRARVLAWNDMHRSGKPRFKTPKVKNNMTGDIYENAYECALAEGDLEESIVWRVERQARHMEDDEARYRYIF